MYQLRHWRRKCEGTVGCKGCPEYGLTAKKPTLCARCADRCKHVSYRTKCAACSLFQVKHDGALCSYCDGTSKRSQMQRRPEVAVVTALMAVFALTFRAADATVRPADVSGCRAFRPDIWFDCGTHALIVEIDEHQHSTLSALCEMERMRKIQEQLGLPTVFIRFNPHAWKTVASKAGRCALPVRIEKLIDEVRHMHNHVPVRDLTVTFMFYDNGGADRWAEMVN